RRAYPPRARDAARASWRAAVGARPRRVRHHRRSIAVRWLYVSLASLLGLHRYLGRAPDRTRASDAGLPDRGCARRGHGDRHGIVSYPPFEGVSKIAQQFLGAGPQSPDQRPLATPKRDRHRSKRLLVRSSKISA